MEADFMLALAVVGLLIGLSANVYRDGRHLVPRLGQGRLGAPDSPKNEAWPDIAIAMSETARRLEALPGVASIHAQYSAPMAVVVVLVDSDAAKRAVRGVEEELFDEWPDLPLDLHVQCVSKDEIALDRAALATAFSLIWARV